jgi:hypothetical protein
MRGIMVSGLVFSSLLCGCAASNSGGAGITAQPAVSFVPADAGRQDNVQDGSSYDFGRIQAGEIAEHSFVLRNKGKKALTITGTVASCGCTSSSVRKKSLAPGEETFLDVKLNSKGYSGAITQFVYVNTDDVDNPAEKFIIKAEVMPRDAK